MTFDISCCSGEREREREEIRYERTSERQIKKPMDYISSVDLDFRNEYKLIRRNFREMNERRKVKKEK